MSKSYDKYRMDTSQQLPVKSYDKYRMHFQGQEETLWDTIKKSAVQGVTDTLDAPANLADLGESGLKWVSGKIADNQKHKTNNRYEEFSKSPNYFREKNVDRPSKWINAEKPKPSNSYNAIIGKAVEYATPGGIIGKFSKGGKALKMASSGAKMGLGSGTLQELGVDPLYADLAVNFSPNISGYLGNIARHPIEKGYYPLGRSILGITPEHINLPAAKAATKLGIDLPTSIFTQTSQAALADQIVQKMPYFGSKLKGRYGKGQEQIEDLLDKIYNKTGPQKTPEIDEQINRLYDKSRENLPKDARIKPKNTAKALEEFNIISDMPSKGEMELLKWVRDYRDKINPVIKSNYGDIKIPLQEREIRNLIGTKQSLNSPDSVIRWNNPDPNIGSKLLPIHSGIKKDIAKYGEINPEWYNDYYTKADKLYADVANRERLENLLGKKVTNYATGDLSYNVLSKAINHPNNEKKLKQMVKRGQLDKRSFDDITDLGKVSRALAVKNKNIPNPSGTVTTSAFLNGLYGLGSNTINIVKGGLGGLLGTDLLTNKNFLNSAIKAAEHPVKKLPLNQRYSNQLRENLYNNYPLLVNRVIKENQAENKN